MNKDIIEEKTKNSSLQNEIDELKQEKKRLESDLAVNTQMYGIFKTRFYDTKREISDLQSRYDDKCQENIRLRAIF